MNNLRVSEETTSSFRVSWGRAPGPVVRYRLTYVPVQEDSGLLETATVGPETTIILQQLYPVTTYRVSVAAEFPSGVGPQMQIDGTTKEGDWNNLKFLHSSRSRVPTHSSIFIGCFPGI